MNPYITFKDKNGDGILQYYILQREWPHYLGVISERPIDNRMIQVPVAGYNLWITFSGTLRGNLIPGFQDVYKEIEVVYQSMADWFYANRILVEPKKYKKWKINDTVTNQ